MILKKVKQTAQEGFTLLEVLLVVAIIAILAGIVIIAINPSSNLAETRNTQRSSDVTTISNALYQYSIDNSGVLPGVGARTGAVAIPTGSAVEICATAPTDCTGLVDLAVLTAAEKYITSIPKDPKCPTGCDANGTGYSIVKTTNGRITIAAMNPEVGKTISVTR